MQLANLGQASKIAEDLQRFGTILADPFETDVALMLEMEKSITDLSETCSTEVLKLALSQTTLEREIVKSTLAAKGLSGAELENAVDTVILSTAQNGAAKTTNKLGNAFDYLKTKVSGTLKSLAVNPFTWIIAGSVAAIAAIGWWEKRQERANEKAIETAESYKEIASEVDNLESKLSDLNKQINALDPITNEEEILALKAETAELEVQLAILKQKEAAARKAADAAAQGALNTTSTSRYSGTTKTTTIKDTYGNDKTIEQFFGNQVTDDEELGFAIDRWYELKEASDEAAKALLDLEAQGITSGGAWDGYNQTIATNNAEMEKVEAHALELSQRINSNISGIDRENEANKNLIATNDTVLDRYVQMSKDMGVYEDALTKAAKESEKFKATLVETFGRELVSELTDEELEIAMKIGFSSEEVKKSIEDVKQQAANEMKKLQQGGGVNLLLRPVIDSSILGKYGWGEFAEGEKATVFSSTFSNEDGTRAINFTPIIADPVTGQFHSVLTPEALDAYATGVIEGVHGDYLNLQIGAVFEGEGAVEEAAETGERISDLQNKFYLDGAVVEQWENLQETVQDTLTASKKVEYTPSDIFAMEDANGTLNDLGKLNEQLDKIQAAYQSLSEAMDTYNKKGYITIDQFQSIVEQGDDFLDYLTLEDGQLDLNEQAMYDLAESRIVEMKAKMIQGVVDNVTKLQDEQDAAKYLKSTNYELADSYQVLAENALTAWHIQSTFSNKDEVLEKAKNDIAKIEALVTKINLKSLSKEETDYKKLLDDEINLLQKQLDAGKITFKQYLDDRKALIQKYYDAGLIEAADYYSELEEYYQAQIDIYDRILSAVERRFDKEIEKIQETIEGIEKQNEALELQLEQQDAILSVVEEVYDKQIDTLKEQQDLLDDQIEKIRDEADENQKLLDIEEARKKLAEARTRRSILLYTEQDGYIYTQNQEEIKQYEDELEGLEREQVIDELEKEKDALQESIDQLEEYKDAWAEIPNLREQAANRELATALWGQNYEQIILTNRTETLEAFKNNYIAIQDQIEDNTKLIESYNEKIEYYEKLKEQWQEIAEARQNALDDQLVAEEMGADWEEQILNDRGDVINNFKKLYIDAQNEMAAAAEEAARRIVKANEDAGTAYDKLKDKNVPTSSSSDSNRHGYTSFVTVSQKAKGGLITEDDESPLDPIAHALGEDHIIAVKEGERVLTPAQNFLWEKYNLSEASLQSLRSFTPDIKPFNGLKQKNNVFDVRPISVTYGDIHIVMNGVNDTVSFAKVLKQQLPSIISQMN